MLSSSPQTLIFFSKTSGQYWQVLGGPVSGLSIVTGKAVLGTHTMEVTVYHRRESQSYVPLAHSCSAFTITGKDLGRGKARCRAVRDGEAWPDWKGERGRGKEELVCNLKRAEPGRPGQRNVGLESGKSQSA